MTPAEAEGDEPPAPPSPQLPLTSMEMSNACQYGAGDIGKIVSLLEAGESPNSVNAIGYTPVMAAIWYMNMSAAKVLFGFGADLSITNNEGRNVLHLAVGLGNAATLSWVLDNSMISIDSTGDDGVTAAMMALNCGNFDAVKLLFERGASLTIVENNGF
jgi:ankyrin repeat protein